MHGPLNVKLVHILSRLQFPDYADTLIIVFLEYSVTKVI